MRFYLASSQKVSDMLTRFHVTETLPANPPPPFLTPGILSAQPGIVGPCEGPLNSVKLDSSHFASCTWQKKKCPPCVFSFCDDPFWSSWEHTTFQPQSTPSPFVNPGIVGVPVMPITLLPLGCNEKIVS
ncbi:hypothetical protein GOODEAATRI_003590 [Goodea atripinnis]|uniref:Uncharacterized protein n=1 Tax=Goodea atripinnis TaxID=208336 RepID=A0ABV0PV88_9TELE